MNIDVQILSPGNWEEYRDLRLQSLLTDPTAFGRSYEEQKDRPEEEWRSNLKDNSRYGARVDGKLVGMLGFRREKGEYLSHMVTLIGMYVDPKFRGNRIGEKLITEVLKDLRSDSSTTKVRLSVTMEQKPARALYQKLGFAQVGLATHELKINGRYHDQAEMELIFKEKL